MKLARIYIKPNGEKWFDLPLRNDQDLGIVFQVMRTEGVIILPSSFCIPSGQVHHMSLLEVPDLPQPTNVWTPPEKQGPPN